MPTTCRSGSNTNLPIFFRDGVVVTIAALVLRLIVAVHAAYASRALQVPGKTLLGRLLAKSMIPGIAILVPFYDLSVHVKLYDTVHRPRHRLRRVERAVPRLAAARLLESMPVELEEAARIDGCSRLKAVLQDRAADGAAGSALPRRSW